MARWSPRSTRAPLLSAAALMAVAAAVDWCADSSASALLTDCGSACTTGDPCVQYIDSTSCSNASRNVCETSSDSGDCTFQCLDAYNTAAKKFTLFVKTPASTDQFSGDSESAFPSAPVDTISGVEFAQEVTAIQITGYDSTDVQKGAVKTVAFADSTFETAPVLVTLVIENVDMSAIASGLLPTTVSTLMMDNCKLSSLPTDIGSMTNLVSLQLSKNYLTAVSSTDAAVTSVLEKLTYLDLGSNALTTFDVVLPAVTSLFLNDNSFTAFPSVIFNMTQLTDLSLDGNTIASLVVTQSEFNFLKRLSSNSTLGVAAASGSCGSGETESTVLGAVVCISTGDASSSSSGSDGGSSGSSSTMIIVVVVLGAVIVVGLIGGFIWWRRKKRAAQNHYEVARSPYATPSSLNTTNNSHPGSTNGTGGNRSSLAGFHRKSTQPSLGSAAYSEISKFAADMQGTGGSGASNSNAASLQAAHGHQRNIKPGILRIPVDEINYTRTIAKGAFGEVWLASYGMELVAVKKLLAVTASGVSDFVTELNLLATLSHPRILSLVGGCWDDQFTDLQIVLEYMDSGDLLTVLRRSPPTELTWESGKAAYCVQICEAVYYLHSLQPALIHRDIKSRNILVDSTKGAKLSDFGESRERTFAHTMTAGVGTARWVAPEIILGEDYSELADIFSLGVLLTELDTHQIPYQTLGLDESMIVQQVAVGKLRPKVSDSCPEIIRRLAHECLQFDPALRPSAARVLQTLMSSSLVRRQPMTLSSQ